MKRNLIKNLIVLCVISVCFTSCTSIDFNSFATTSTDTKKYEVLNETEKLQAKNQMLEYFNEKSKKYNPNRYRSGSVGEYNEIYNKINFDFFHSLLKENPDIFLPVFCNNNSYDINERRNILRRHNRANGDVTLRVIEPGVSNDYYTDLSWEYYIYERLRDTYQNTDNYGTKWLAYHIPIMIERITIVCNETFYGDQLTKMIDKFTKIINEKPYDAWSIMSVKNDSQIISELSHL